MNSSLYGVRVFIWKDCASEMLIVTCQVCGDCKVLAGAPDGDGLARTCWICPCCGSGQVVQLEVPTNARGDLCSIVLGMKMEARKAEAHY